MLKNKKHDKAEAQAAEVQDESQGAVEAQGESEWGYVDGAWRTPEEMTKAKARWAAGERIEHKDFTPNPYLSFKEKCELADMVWRGHAGDSHKNFVDPRHRVIHKHFQEDLSNKRIAHDPASLLKALKDRHSLEAAGGLSYFMDIFQGLPKQ